MQFGINLHKWVFQKIEKFNKPAGRAKFELFEKITSANQFQIEREKSYDYLLITYMKKLNGRSLTGSKGSCLLCWMFGSSLQNLGKSTGEYINNLPTSFRNFWKSSEKIGKCRKWLKMTFLHFNIFMKSSEIIGSLRKFSEICHKVPSDNFWKF